MGVGRFFCVALPFALTIGSIIFLLVGSLAGVSDKSLRIFRIDVTNLEIDSTDVENLVDKITSKRADVKIDNITAADLGLSKFYDINLWGYCHTDQDGDRHCTKPKFDWAADSLNTSYIEDFGSAAGVKLELPKDIKNSLKAFITVTKWTEVVVIASFIALAVQVLLGLFANCSTIASCCTWIVSGVTAALVCGAAGLATAMAAVVTGAVEASAKVYGVRGKIDTKFLSIVWIAAAFAIGACVFWIFTICCCKPEKRTRISNKKNRNSDGEKLLPTGAYAPLGTDHHEMSPAGGYYNHNQAQSQHGAPRYPSGVARSDLAYEPYSHRA